MVFKGVALFFLRLSFVFAKKTLVKCFENWCGLWYNLFSINY